PPGIDAIASLTPTAGKLPTHETSPTISRALHQGHRSAPASHRSDDHGCRRTRERCEGIDRVTDGGAMSSKTSSTNSFRVVASGCRVEEHEEPQAGSVPAPMPAYRHPVPSWT